MSNNSKVSGEIAELLLVEDNPGDIKLIRKSFEKAKLNNALHVVQRVDEALNFMFQRGQYTDAPSVDLVLLDIQLPDGSGLDVLQEIKDDDDLRRVPVVVLTSSEAEEDIVTSYDRHANAYLTKPVDFPDLINLVQQLSDFWFTLVKRPKTSS